MQKAPNLKHPGNPGYMRRTNLRIIGIEESEDSQLKGPVNIFNKKPTELQISWNRKEISPIT